MKHKTRLLPLLLLLVFTLTGCYEGLSKRQMLAMVQAHHAEIEAAIQSGRAETLQNQWGIREARLRENGHVDFFCAGAGMGGNTRYFGVYYSPEDQPYDICSWAGDIAPQGDGWGWQEEKGDNTFYTERILERFFYYEYSF